MLGAVLSVLRVSIHLIHAKTLMREFFVLSPFCE